MEDLMADARIWLLGTSRQTKIVITKDKRPPPPDAASSSTTNDDTGGRDGEMRSIRMGAREA